MSGDMSRWSGTGGSIFGWVPYPDAVRAQIQVEQSVTKLNTVLNGQVELTERAWHEVNRRAEGCGLFYGAAIESVYDDVVSGRLT